MNSVFNFGKRFLKTLARGVGVDVRRVGNSPEVTLLGLRDRRIQSIFDVGANRGQFAKRMRHFFPGAHIYCFEPLEEPFKYLSAWAGQQEGHVTCFNVALGERDGGAIMHLHLDHSSSSSLLPTTPYATKTLPQTADQVEVSVQISRLDSMTSSFEIRPEILLKLDVQGYEERVLRGAPDMLERAHVCLAEVSLDPFYTSQAKFKDLVLLLDEHGFGYAGNMDQVYGPDGRAMWLDALFLKR